MWRLVTGCTCSRSMYHHPDLIRVTGLAYSICKALSRALLSDVATAGTTPALSSFREATRTSPRTLCAGVACCMYGTVPAVPVSTTESARTQARVHRIYFLLSPLSSSKWEAEDVSKK